MSVRLKPQVEPAIAAIAPSCLVPSMWQEVDWPIVRSGPRPWVFWGPFWRPDRMVWSQNGLVSKVFFRPDCSVQSNLYRKMGTVSETRPYGLCQEWSHPDWTIWSGLDQMKKYWTVS